jgi:hypothetical protein
LLPAFIFRAMTKEQMRSNSHRSELCSSEQGLHLESSLQGPLVRVRSASQPCGKLHLVNGHITLDGRQLWILALSSNFTMCIYQNTTTSRPFLATKGSEVRASSPSPKCSFIVKPSRMTPIPKISLTMRVRRTTALPFALTENLDTLFYEPTQLFYEDEVLTNADYCFMNPEHVVGQRSALDSPPPLRRPSRYTSIIPPTVLPERLIFPDF